MKTRSTDLINKWIIKNPDESTVKSLASKGGISPLAAKVLVSAGIDTMEKAMDFFGQNDDNDGEEGFLGGFSDPFLIRDMEKACDLIRAAVDSGELICVYGDYDCDGITSTAVLAGYLRDIGGNVITHINEREQGYGMNIDAVKALGQRGVSTIITVDNGISAIAEAELCAELGITLVITDHHQQGDELPGADAVVDPHRHDCPSPYKDYCGCGLVLKLIAAMEGGDMECAVEQYSDLAAIATVADVVPLTGENREIVRHGLHYLENTENPGLKALVEKAGIKAPFTSTDAAFSLAPRINAAGRIGSPLDALELLMEEDPERAVTLAERICEQNVRRKDFENHAVADIAAQIKADAALLDRRVLVFSGTDWHHGVIGIAAARCVERFGKPVFLMSANEDGSELRGSARSVDGFNIFKALLYCKDVLTKFGGHSGAGGFSLEPDKLPELRSMLEEYAEQCAADSIPVQVTNVCGSVSAAELTVDAVSGLDILEPFGEGNPRPVFLLADCVISEVIPLKDGAHTKLLLSGGGHNLTGLMFGTKTADFPYRKGEPVNALISPEINTFNGRSSVSLRIADIRRRGINQAKIISAEDTYCSFRKGNDLGQKIMDYIKPQRDDLAVIYRAVGNDTLTPFALYGRVSHTEMNYCRFLICLDVFSEAGLINYDRCSGKVSIIKGAPKADTAQTPTMRRFS